MTKRWQIFLGTILFLTACSQDAAWQSACGCAFNLSDDDKGLAQKVALDGDLPAMTALFDHFSINEPEDEATLWKTRIANRSQYVANVKAATKRIVALQLSALHSREVAAHRRLAELGDIPATRWMAAYLDDIGLSDEAQLWRNRRDGIDNSSEELRATEAIVLKAERAQDWTSKAPLIETAYYRLETYGEANKWLPHENVITAPYEGRLAEMVVTRLETNKESVSYDLCMSAIFWKERRTQGEWQYPGHCPPPQRNHDNRAGNP